MGISRRRVCAVFSAFAVLLAGCATARSDARVRTSAEELGWQPATAAVYAQMALSMSRTGEIYQPTISMIETQGPLAFSTRTRVSIDVPNTRARGEIEAAFTPQNVKRTTWIITGRRYHQTLEYDPTFMREATTCRGTGDPLVAILLACRGTNERGVTTTLRNADYHGQPALALLTLGGVESPGVRATFTDTLFLDPSTYLPIAQEGSGRIETLSEDGAVLDSQATGRLVLYEHKFRPVSDYAVYHFDPASIGFVESDIVALVTKPRPDITLQWFGADAAIAEQPPIALRDAFVAENGDRPSQRYRALLTYRPIENEFGPTLLEVQQWRPDEWQVAHDEGYRAWPPDVCVVKEDVTVQGMPVVLYHGYSAQRRNTPAGVCPAAPPDRFVALVTTPYAILRIVAPTDGIFNTREDMLAAVEALRPVN